MNRIFKIQLIVIFLILVMACKEHTEHNFKNNDLKSSSNNIGTKDTLFGNFYYGMAKDSSSLSYDNGYTFYNDNDSINFNYSLIWDKNNKLDTLILSNYSENTNNKNFEFILHLYEDKYGPFKKRQVIKKKVAYKYYALKRIFWRNKDDYHYSINKNKIHDCGENPFLCAALKCYMPCEDQYSFHIQNTNLKTGNLESFNVEMEEKDSDYSLYLLTSYYKIADSKYIEINHIKYIETAKDRKKFDYTKRIDFFQNNKISIKYSYITDKTDEDATFVDKQKINKSDI